MTNEEQSGRVRKSLPRNLSLREFLGWVTVVALLVGLVLTGRRLAKVEGELAALRREVGHLAPSEPDEIAAVRVPSDLPLTYRMRVRVPQSRDYRVAYSSLLPKHSATPQWYGAVPVPPGESVVTVRVAKDPRDERWKITTLVNSSKGTQRMSTVLPPDHVGGFRETHDVVSTGVGRETLAVQPGESIRLLDERWLVGDAGLLLFGDRPPPEDQMGVYAELQPNDRPF